MTNATAEITTTLALLSAPQVVAAVRHAVRTGGPEAAGQVGRDIEEIIDPCALNNGADGIGEGFGGWDDPYLVSPERQATTCPA